MKQRDKVTVGKNRWATYAVAGAAAAISGGQSANADIHHFDVNTEMLGNAGTSLDLLSLPGLGSSNGAELVFAHNFNGSTQGFAGLKLNAASAGTAQVRGFSDGYFSVFPYVSALNAGDAISAGPFSAMSGGQYGRMAMSFNGGVQEFTGVGEQFIGFQFNNGAGVQYGWARVEMADDGLLNAYTVVDYAYGDVGDTIEAGQLTAVPEPGSLGLLALGAAGLGVWRRRRKSVA